MMVLSTVLLIINRISFVLLVFISPFALYDFLFGRARAEKMLEKFNCRLRAETIDIFGVVLVFVVFVTYIIRDQIIRHGLVMVG